MHISIETVEGKSINLELEDSSETIDLKIHGPTRQLVIRLGSDPGPDAGMMISVSTLTGKTYNLQVEGTETVEQVMAMIHGQGGPPVKDQRLIFRGKQLENRHTIAEYGIKNESSLIMMSRLCGC